MKNILPYLLTASLLFAAPATLSAETRYITDLLHVPVRSGMGNEFRILHRGLPSGTQLELLEDIPTEGWARIRTPKGTEGWVRSQYLISEPVAKLKLAQAENNLARFEQLEGNLGGEVQRLEEENGLLSTSLSTAREQNQTLATELKALKALSADALDLNERHQKLLHQYELLKQEKTMVEAEIQRLSGSESHKWYLYGALSVVLGALLAMIAPHMRPRKRHTEWAN
ncbi:TIGR04211 family SH3 domain-containing protein [Microbulbifer sp. 2205BS26-8]|uniref:TIGR04211 family SH3 domain-containing protein n=1 Tax=Microbulbifer sp. 2205BS26-8 TaxID=3064386 RepID=UPI0027402F4E|nr:TIGR04211 family SH3 domain-containing protein [Microbulbifer sp. 2205BS26-8]MDP5208958.1 TIGR04211 family SH3 domain-containing protein [Microbulbifer sp. 2205BS26-8]